LFPTIAQRLSQELVRALDQIYRLAEILLVVEER